MFDQQHRVVDEQAGRLASGITIDAPAIRLPVAGEVATHRADRCAVRPTRMAIHARQPHGPIGEGSIQVGQPRSAYFELVSEDGRVLGNALQYIPSSITDGVYSFNFPFEISASRYTGSARLTMQQFGVDIYGIESLASVLLDIDI